MKKSLITWMAAILITISAQAQDRCLPEKTVDGVIADLQRYDALVIKSYRQDSIIFLQDVTIKRDNLIISKHEAKDVEQDIIISNKQELLDGANARNKDLKRSNTKLKIQKTIFTLGLIAETIGIIALLILL